MKPWLRNQLPEVSAEELEANYQEHVEGLKWRLLSDQLCKEYNVKLEHEDLAANIKTFLEKNLGQRIPPEEAEELIEEFLEEKEYEKLYAKVRMDQLFDLIKEEITIEQEPISAEAFNALTRSYD